MNRKPLLALALAVLVLAIVLTLRWQATREADVASPQAAAASPADEPVLGSPRTEALPAAPRFDDASPSRVLATPGPVEDLATRAGAGDALAACQLAAELGECRSQEVLRRLATDAQAYRPTPRCDALLARHRDKHFDWLRQAAHAGEPEAMLRYAQGEGFGISGASFDYLRSPHFDTLRREALAMLDALLEAGYPEAAFTRMMANDALLGGPLAGLFPSEPVTDRAYSELFLLLQSDPTLTGLMRERMRSRPGSADREAALALAMRWHQDYFKGNSYVFDQGESSNGFELMQSQGKACSVVPGEAEP